MLRKQYYTVCITMTDPSGDSSTDLEYIVDSDTKDTILRRIQDVDDPFLEFDDEDEDGVLIRKSLIRDMLISKSTK
jgi:hypothetical protein